MGWGGREVGLCTERKSIEGENFYGVLKCVMNGRFLRRSICVEPKHTLAPRGT